MGRCTTLNLGKLGVPCVANGRDNIPITWAKSQDTSQEAFSLPLSYPDHLHLGSLKRLNHFVGGA